MGIGISIFLMAAGAILAFAVDYRFTAVNVPVVGIILMAVGALGLIVTLFMWGPRRRSSRTVTTDEAYPPADRPGYPRATHTQTREYRDTY